MFIGGSMAEVSVPLPTGVSAEIPVQTDWQSTDNTVSVDVSCIFLHYSCISYDFITSIYQLEVLCGSYLEFRYLPFVIYSDNIRFEVLMTMTMKNAVFWDVVLHRSFENRCLARTCLSTLKMEATLSSEMSVLTRPTRRHIPKDRILYSVNALIVDR
jgi:hypothetical protein